MQTSAIGFSFYGFFRCAVVSNRRSCRMTKAAAITRGVNWRQQNCRSCYETCSRACCRRFTGGSDTAPENLIECTMQPEAHDVAARDEIVGQLLCRARDGAGDAFLAQVVIQYSALNDQRSCSAYSAPRPTVHPAFVTLADAGTSKFSRMAVRRTSAL